MTVALSINTESLNRFARNANKTLLAVRVPAHKAMASTFHVCTDKNFGQTGEFRPHPWRQLTRAYAKKVGRRFATLLISGFLKNAVKERANAQSGNVSISKSDVVYALAQQWGYSGNNLPARPYFPLYEDGSMMPSVKTLCVKSAQQAVRKALL